MVTTRLKPVPQEPSLTLQPVDNLTGSARGNFRFFPYQSIEVPRERKPTRLFEGIQVNGKPFEGGPELALMMADGKGHLVPMEVNAQKLLFKEIAQEARAHFPADMLKKLESFTMTPEGIVFFFRKSKKHVDSKTIPWEGAGKWIPEKQREGTPTEIDDTGEGEHHLLFQFVALERSKEVHEQILDLRPVKLAEPSKGQDNELPARKSLRDLMYFIMLAHKGIGDNLSQRGRPSFSELDPDKIPEAMNERFSHSVFSTGYRS
jgi:hypothetical protein